MSHTLINLFDKHFHQNICQDVTNVFEEFSSTVKSVTEAHDALFNAVLSNPIKFKKQSNKDRNTEDKLEDNIEDDNVFVKPIEPQKKKVRTKKTEDSSNERTGSESESKGELSTEENSADTVFARPSEPQKKRVRGKKTLNELSICVTSSDSDVGTADEGSSRSRRAAAQAADKKRAQTESFMNSTKLRRPTDFDIKKATNNLSSPPAKTRKTCLAESTPPVNITGDDEQDVQNKDQIVEPKETPSPSIDSSNLKSVDKTCTVRIERLTARTSSKRKSEDLFDNSPTLEDAQETVVKSKKTGKLSSIPSVVLVNCLRDAHSNERNSPINLISPPSDLDELSIQVTENNTKKSRKGTFVMTKDIQLELTEEIEEKTIKKSQKEENGNVVETETTNVRSRTRVLKKKDNNINQQEMTPEIVESDKENNHNNNKTFIVEREPSPSHRSRTRTIKRSVNIKSQTEEHEDEQCEKVDNCDTIPLKVPAVNKYAPSPAKGQHVKKTVEVFEKMKDSESSTTRVTRAKNKVLETHSTKNKIGNAAASVVRTNSTERRRLTPLSGSRVTPIVPTSSKHIRGPSPSQRNPAPHVACTTTVIREDEDSRKNRGNILKAQQAKEEEERKKKQAEKAKREEDKKRKKEEHRQKVAAAREAVEREKAQLAARAEKEKEEKLQQLAAEKEKQREEELQRKKLLQQQRAQEHEDRRKQEEAARIAKLKEQEQEHKRIVAAKEREKELKKQLKTAETQHAATGNEVNKMNSTVEGCGQIATSMSPPLFLHPSVLPKHWASKADKVKTTTVAKAVDNTSQNKNTPQAGQPPSQSYEVTPARDERPLLPPKTENDYGIDDANSSDSSEDESQPKKQIPLWALPKNRLRSVQIDHYVPQLEKRVFMERNPKPDLLKLFVGCTFKSRARTSSAVWNTPPRFDMNTIGKKL